MRVRLVVAALLAVGLSGFTVRAQEVPTLEVDPDVVMLGETTAVEGSGFEPGVVTIYFNSTDNEPAAAPVEHVGQFNFKVEIAGLNEGPHFVIACNNESRTGICRQEARAALRVVAGSTTTTSPRVTTTTRPVTTTTAPQVTTTTVQTAAITTTSTSPARQTTTIAPGVVTIAPTTVGGLAVATTVAGPGTIPPNVVASIPDGPDPTFDPTPDDLAIVTTTEGPSFQSGSNVGDYPDLSVVAIEVSQGIQNMNSTMPLVADRTTWIRVHVDSEGVDSWAPVDGALLLQRSGRPNLVMVPDNGPIATKQPRTNINSTLNFEVPDAYLGDGSLSITALVWAFDASSLDTVEPNPGNNQMQETVEFHTADIPTIWLVALDDGAGPGWVVNDLTPLLGFAQIVHQDLLDYHPTAYVNYEAYPTVVEPGPEALVPDEWKLGWAPSDDPDDEDNEATDMPRRSEPNARVAWLTADLLDEANVLSMIDPATPTDGYSGWATDGVAWNKPAAGTPAHEFGHNRDLKHVACKDADGNGVPDEIKGGAIDPYHPNGLPPQCSLAPITPLGYYGLTTERGSLTVYSNDPTDPAAAYPFMSYKNPGWTDPYDWCLLLDFVSVPCSPAGIGVPPKVLQYAADCDPEPIGNGFGLELCLIDQLPPPSDPFGGDNAGTVPFGGPIEYGFQTACDSAMTVFTRFKGVAGESEGPAQASWPCTPVTSADGTTEHFFTVEIAEGDVEIGTIVTPSEPDAWMLVSGYVDLESGEAAIRQMAMRETIPESLRQRYLDNIVGAVTGVSPMAYSLSVRTEDGGAVSRIPLDLDGAGHGDGSERGAIVGFFQVIPAAAGCSSCFVRIDHLDGEIERKQISPQSPSVGPVQVSDTGDSTLIEWTATDPDGEPLTFDVLWSADGEEWIHAATGISDTSLLVPQSARYPGGGAVEVRVVANDGSRTGTATSAPFTAPGHDPLLFITGVPESGSAEQYDTVLLQAQVMDPEDKGPQPDTVVWRSDLGGELHVGPLLRTRDLVPGLHSFTVEAADADGNAVTTGFQLQVIPRSTPTRYLESPDAAAVARLTGEPPTGDPLTNGGEGPATADAVAAADAADPPANDSGGSSLPLVIGLLAAVGMAGAAAFGVRRRHLGGRA